MTSNSYPPCLSARRQAALKAVQFLPGFKLLLKFLETFYPDAINCGLNQGDDGEKVFYDIAFEKGAQTNVLGFLATGTATEPYCETPIFFPRVQNLRTLPHNVMCRRHGIPFSNCTSSGARHGTKAVLKELDKIYDYRASRTFTGEYWLEDWGRKRYTQGSWVVGSNIKPSTLTEINTPLADTVYFAGEAHDAN